MFAWIIQQNNLFPRVINVIFILEGGNRKEPEYPGKLQTEVRQETIFSLKLNLKWLEKVVNISWIYFSHQKRTKILRYKNISVDFQCF